MTNTVNQDECVIIIGAGASGLAAAHQLKAHGIPVRIVDKAHRAGDAWYHRHPQLHLNTHRHLSHLPGMAIKKAAGAFPSRDSIIQYLKDYAGALDVPIDYGVSVKNISKASKGWIIETDRGAYITQNIVVATGHDRLPYIPAWPGLDLFDKPLIHAADFGQLSNYRDKKVLVIGAGNSGTDILNHLSGIKTNKLWVSVRHGPVVFPRRLYGVPVQRLSPVLARFPARVVDAMLRLTEYLAFGDLKKWGLSKHPDGGATRLLQSGIAPAIDNGFIAALKAGNIQIVSEILEFGINSVKLTDAQTIDPDIVIAATGYRTGLESMISMPGVLDKTGIPIIHGAEQLSDYPGLYFTGMQPRLTGFFHSAGKTGDEIAKAINGRYKANSMVLNPGTIEAQSESCSY